MQSSQAFCGGGERRVLPSLWIWGNSLEPGPQLVTLHLVFLRIDLGTACPAAGGEEQAFPTSPRSPNPLGSNTEHTTTFPAPRLLGSKGVAHGPCSTGCGNTTCTPGACTKLRLLPGRCPFSSGLLLCSSSRPVLASSLHPGEPRPAQGSQGLGAKERPKGARLSDGG